jgi:DNA adenine methylase
MAQAAYAIPTEREINVASVPHRSPFRYPGGKTWLIPYIRLWLRHNPRRYRELIEPFAGGAIVGVSAAFEGLVDKVTLVELDPDVAAVWATILGRDGEKLAARILTFEPTLKSVMPLLEAEPKTTPERAFVTIIRNRVQRGGILAPGAGLMNKGENGKGLASRWYPETLYRRIMDLISIKHKIHFLSADGVDYIRRNRHRKSVAFFVDPPYTVAGRRLYKFSEMDHKGLFDLLGKSAGEFLMTYDDSSEIRHLVVQSRFDCETVAMKNTHNACMTELLVGKKLDWLRIPKSSQLPLRGF